MDYRELARQAAIKHGLNPNLFVAQIQQESNFNPVAKSHRGALGLSQIMPATAQRPGFNVAPLQGDILDPETNLDFGARYMKAMLDRYDGDYTKALAAYNAGAGNVDKAGGVPNFKETRNYVDTIMNNPIYTKTLDGRIKDESLIGNAQAAINRGQPLPEGVQPQTNPLLSMLGIGDAPVPQAPPQGPSGGALSIWDAPWEKGAGLKSNLKGVWNSLDPEYRQQALLTMGAGLLSGNNWREGLAAGFDGVAGVREGIIGDRRQQSQFDQQMAQRQAEFGMRMSQGQDFIPVGSVTTPSGEEIGGVSYDRQTGQYFTWNDDGSRRVINGAIPLNRSDASGSKGVTPTIMSDLTEKVSTERATLRSVDNILERIQTHPSGAMALKESFDIALKTFLGRNNLTPEELNMRIARNEVQGLIGKAKDEVVGPGVMTEQDALRIIAYLGGDLSWMSNPQVAEQRLLELGDKSYKSLQRNLNQYNSHRTVPGFESWLEIDGYTPKYLNRDRVKGDAALDQSNTDDIPPPPDGIDPEDWKFLTPQERELFR